MLENLKDVYEAANRVKQEVKKVILGVDRAIDLVTISLFSRGHCLLEGPPGQAKTTMFLAFSKAINGQFARFQGIPDALPSDIYYATDIDEKGHLKFHLGPLLLNSLKLGIVLVDEINRFQSKTQAAFLEAMQERKVTLGRQEFELPHVIFVATRNPLEKQQTYELPAAQIDRFLMEVELGHPDQKSERQIISDVRFLDMKSLIEEVRSVMDLPELTKAHEIIQTRVKVSEAIITYIHEIVKATRDPKKSGIKLSGNEDPSKWLKAGVSTRGGIRLLETAKTAAALRGSNDLLPRDIQNILNEVLAHRIFIQPFAESRRSSVVKEFLEEIKKAVRAPE